jgi:molybdopterin converting factor small subunit
MAIMVTLHPFLNDGVEAKVEVQGRDLGECLKDIMKRFPGIDKKLFGSNGKLKGYVEIMVNGQSTYPQELAYPVKDGDSVSVLVFLAGG